MFKKLIDRIFKMEAIDGGGICPPYLYRWTLLSIFGYKFYLHHFVGDDWALDPHDHPKRFISIGLKGYYFEDVYCSYDPSDCSFHIYQSPIRIKKFVAPWYRTFPANHIHRIRASESGSCWTLVIVGKSERQWGFWKKLKFIPWDEYVWGGGARKSC